MRYILFFSLLIFQSTMTNVLRERLAKGPLVCAEGYLFEMERRGYLKAGGFVPEVILEHPEVVKQLHYDFVHAGSDVVLTFTYYAHREKLRLIGREEDLEKINRTALRIARNVARDTKTLFAGNICNTNIYNNNDKKSAEECLAMFDEQVRWAKEEGADFVVAETFSFLGEALLALNVIKKYGLPSVVTLALHKDGITRDGYTPEEACKKLEEAGVDVVGLNCMRGPDTMLPALGKIRKICKGFIAGLPVAYHTTEQAPTFFSLTDPLKRHSDDVRSFPTHLDPFVCTRYEIEQFTKKAYAMGIRYLGVCCGAGPHHIRAMANALNKKVAASKYNEDMSQHYALGNKESLLKENKIFVDRL